MLRGTHRLLVFGVALGLAGLRVGTASAALSTDERAIDDEKNGEDWISNGRTHRENHYSPLSSININNIKSLGLAWFLDLPGERALEATPLAVNGTLYFSGTNSKVFAVDAASGKVLWTFDADPPHHSPRTLRYIFGTNRGVAYWHDKVYVGTVDGRLIALAANSGRVIWSVQTYDNTISEREISGAPRVFNGKVIIGEGNADFRGVRGFVSAYDANSGRLIWRFYTVPGAPKREFESRAMAMAAKTWHGRWWPEGGGGAVWDSIVYDPELDRVYIGTANGSPIDRSRSDGRGGSAC